MLRRIGGLYFGDAISQRLIVRARRGELSINFERELPVSLLQVQLRHRFVDERLRARTGESALFYCCRSSWSH